jgi:hypothetical protein
MQLLRTTTAAKVPNTVNLPNAGQLALNMTDQVLYSRDTGTNIFAIGNNLPVQVVGTSLTVGNSTVNAAINSISATFGNSTANSYINSSAISSPYHYIPYAPGGGVATLQVADSGAWQVQSGKRQLLSGYWALELAGDGQGAGVGLATGAAGDPSCIIIAGQNDTLWCTDHSRNKLLSLSNTGVLTVANSTANTFVVNNYISGNGYGITSVTATAAPGGTNTTIQFNDSATTAGDANLTWNKTSALLTIGNSTVNVSTNSTQLIVGNSSGISVTTASILVGNSSVNTYINSSAVLINGSPVGGGSPGGSNTMIQFNNSASFAGDPNFLWDYSADKFYVGNSTSTGTPTLQVGNSTVNVIVNTTSIYVGAVSTTTVGLQLANSSIKIGNSSVNATLNSTAFSGLSLTANNSTYLNGEAANAFIQIKSFDVLAPVSSDSYTLFWTNCAITIAEIKTLVQNSVGATPWVNSSFYWGTSRAVASNTILGNANTSNITTGNTTTSFTNATVAANSFVWCTLNGLSNATEFHASIRLS